MSLCLTQRLLDETHIKDDSKEEIGQAKCIFTSTLETDLVQILTFLGS